MRKIISIFMVAVLSLNLLYQPCEAGGNQRTGSNYQQQMHGSDSHSQGKISCTRKLLNLVKTALKVSIVIAFGVFMYCVGAVGGVLNGFKAGKESVLDNDVKTIAKEHCEATGSCLFFPTGEMSKNCLKALAIAAHPDNRKCSKNVALMFNNMLDKNNQK